MENNILLNFISVFVQVVFIFSFLVIFYFLYVINVEKNEFESQINILTNNFLDNLKNVKINLNEKSVFTEDNLKLIFLGILDTAKEKVRLDYKNEIDEIDNHNNKLKNTCFIIVIILIIITGLSLFLLKTLPGYEIFKESFTVVFFVAITELFFLKFVSEKYIAADPNKVNYKIGIAIKNWLKKNGKI
jgi:hypothetical protein